MKAWLLSNSDKLLLYSLVILGGLFIIHVMHHGGRDVELLSWSENSFSTVLGALILILTGRGIQRSADQQKVDNGTKPTNGVVAPVATEPKPQ